MARAVIIAVVEGVAGLLHARVTHEVSHAQAFGIVANTMVVAVVERATASA